MSRRQFLIAKFKENTVGSFFLRKKKYSIKVTLKPDGKYILNFENRNMKEKIKSFKDSLTIERAYNLAKELIDSLRVNAYLLYFGKLDQPSGCNLTLREPPIKKIKNAIDNFTINNEHG